MTNKRQKLDIELLRLRNQSQPEKAKESLKPLITKYSSNGMMTWFVLVYKYIEFL